LRRSWLEIYIIAIFVFSGEEEEEEENNIIGKCGCYGRCGGMDVKRGFWKQQNDQYRSISKVVMCC